jgi:hypothetical protein
MVSTVQERTFVTTMLNRGSVIVGNSLRRIDEYVNYCHLLKENHFVAYDVTMLTLHNLTLALLVWKL